MTLRWRLALVADVVLSTATALLNLYIITRFYEHPLVFSVLSRALRGVWTEGVRCARGSRWAAPRSNLRILVYLVLYVGLVGASIALSLYVMANMAIAAILVVDALYPGVLLTLGGAIACVRRLRPSYAPIEHSYDTATDEQIDVRDAYPRTLLHAPPSRTGLRAVRALAVAVIVGGSVLTVVGPGSAPIGWAALEFATLVLSAVAAYVHTAWLREPLWRPEHIVRMVVWPEVALLALLAAVVDRPNGAHAVARGAAWALAFTLIDVPRYYIDLYVRAGGGTVLDPIVMSVVGNVVNLAVICLNMWITRTAPTQPVVLGIGVCIVGIILFLYSAARLGAPPLHLPSEPSTDLELDDCSADDSEGARARTLNS